MQIVAEVWLILKLTGSGTAVGLVAALQFAPILLFGAFGGMLADRVPKQKLLQVTQVAMAVPALALFALYASGAVEAWMVCVLVFLRGTINAVDNPTRQSFVIEMVGPGLVVNAVSLNSVIVHAARIVGPAIAGALIAVWGVGPCFLVNALSFTGMVVALRRMEPSELATVRPVPREKGALRAALSYVRATRALRVPLLMMALVGTLSFNFIVLLPLLARFSFHGDASTYAGLMTAMGVGSVIGALVSGARGRVSPKVLTVSAAAFGLLILLLAAAPTIAVAAAVLVPLGAASVTFAAGINSALQLAVTGEMRGRVMALYSMVFIGSAPIGGPLAGWLAETWSPRIGLLMGGVAALLAALYGRRCLTSTPYSSATPACGKAATSGLELHHGGCAGGLGSPNRQPDPPRSHVPAQRPARPARAGRGTARTA